MAGAVAQADLKLVLLGHKNVGKTSVFNRYVYDEFGKTSMTIGAYFHMSKCEVDDRTVHIAIWDTAGEEKFDSLTNFYCRNARAALVCYDITNKSTFSGLERWVTKVSEQAEKNCAVILVGNKVDVVEQNPEMRQVSLAEAQRYASSINAVAMEVSAKTGANIKEVFKAVVSTWLDRQVAEAQIEQGGRKGKGKGKGKKDVNLGSKSSSGSKCC